MWITAWITMLAGSIQLFKYWKAMHRQYIGYFDAFYNSIVEYIEGEEYCYLKDTET